MAEDPREKGLEEMLAARRESSVKILYNDFDTLRPDHLYTSDSPCLPARTALQTGVPGQHHSALQWYAGFNEVIQDG